MGDSSGVDRLSSLASSGMSAAAGARWTVANGPSTQVVMAGTTMHSPTLDQLSLADGIAALSLQSCNAFFDPCGVTLSGAT